MNERVEKIKPISRIRSVRRIVLLSPKRDGRELLYQFNRFPKPIKKKVAKTKPPETSTHQEKSIVSSEVISKEVKDIKKRLAFDRAIIIGDES